jgi:hypothetical protein
MEQGDAGTCELSNSQICRSHFLAQSAQLGALGLFLWSIYTILLGPLWGWHLLGMGEWITERADFLRSHGHSPHPILEQYKNIPLVSVWLGGSLYGALFLAWPVALWMACGEMLSAQLKGWKASLLRLVWAFTLIRVEGDLIFVFCDGVIVPALAWGIIFASPMVVRWVIFWGLSQLQSIKNHTKSKTLVWLQRLCRGMVFFMFVPLMIHPVWSIWLTPERIDPKIKIKPLIRDMLLLNEDGESWVNNWYYSYAPLINEKERVTSFQPMVVGLVGVSLAAWGDKFRFGFQNAQNPQGQRLVFIELQKTDDISLWLQRGLLDYVAVEASLANSPLLSVAQLPQGSIGYYSNLAWSEADGELKFDPNHYFRLREGYSESPITRHRDALRQLGYIPDQSKCMMKGAQRLFKVFNQPWILLSVAGLMLLGLAYVMFVVVEMVALKLPWVLLLMGALLIFNSSGLSSVLKYWKGDGHQSTFWSKVIDLHLKAVQLRPEDLQSVLAKPLDQDQRCAMLEVSVLGRSYIKSTTSSQMQLQIIERFRGILAEYHLHPLNFRYKVIDAVASIPELREELEKVCREEQHLYVRWYGAERGLGL